MATNLRLRDDAASALREASERSGRSQQDIIREAIDRHLGLVAEPTDLDRAVAEGRVRPPSAFLDVRATTVVAASVLDLLDRDER